MSNEEEDADLPKTSNPSPSPSPTRPREVVEDQVVTRSRAASIIWRAWASYKMKKQYRYLRDMISDVNYMNPYDTLKIINPSEAKLVDKASGTVIRFRFGGEYFPPNVYYKIGTSRPVVDMCAMSPRDYAAHPAVWTLDTHNKPSKKPSPQQDKDDWYKRFENNGWRLVTESDFKFPGDQDPVTLQTSRQKKEFHYSKVVRQKDLEKKRKEQKIAWMLKMYKAGKEREAQEKNLSQSTMGPQDDGPSRVDVQQHQKLQGAQVEPELLEEDMVPEEEVEKLIEWSQRASFDQYQDDWSTLACVTFTESPEDFAN